MTDWGGLYRQHVAAVSALAATLSGDELRRRVPGTPAWTTYDVLAHLAGASSDVVTGRMDRAPAPEWTARHVSERLGLTVAELTAELVSHQDAIAASTLHDPRLPIVWDIVVHHVDLGEALAHPRLPEPLWRPVLDAAAPLVLGPTSAEAGAVDPYEMFRALFSRRSRRQMRAWGLPLSDEQLDRLCIFGPREDDQPVPD